MSKYTELQTRKILSAYGGVGSIIETPEGALMIKPFDHWQYFALINKGRIEIEENERIEDIRLFERLKHYFPNLEQLVKVPANYSKLYGSSSPRLDNHIINAKYFPIWMYCNNCGRLKPLDEWYKKWKDVHQGGNINKINEAFHPPKCYACYQKAKKEKKGKKFHSLEQIRFILTAPNGAIKDLPWNLWTNLSRPNKEERKSDEENSASGIVFNGECCGKQDLRYIKSDKYADFSSVMIQCKNTACPTNGKRVTLAGLYSIRLPDYEKNGSPKLVKDKDNNIILDDKGKPQKVYFKPVIRTSNSVYYPLITNSLYLPNKALKRKTKEKIKTLYESADFSVEEIQQTLRNKDEIEISLGEIEEVLNPKSSDFISEIEY
ncbi:MAG: hypothetical protein AAF849_21930, partial [Bacteroidota bacterium]